MHKAVLESLVWKTKVDEVGSSLVDAKPMVSMGKGDGAKYLMVICRVGISLVNLKLKNNLISM